MTTPTQAALAAYLSGLMRRFPPVSDAGRKLGTWLDCNKSTLGIDLPSLEDISGSAPIPAAKWRDMVDRLAVLRADADASDVLDKNACAFTTALGLDARDAAIFRFVLATDCDTTFEQLCSDLIGTRAIDATGIIAAALGCGTVEILSRLQGGKLRGLQLVDAGTGARDSFTLAVHYRIIRALLPPNDGTSDIERSLVGVPMTGELGPADYGHVADEHDFVTRLLRGAIAKRQAGINILIHGVPGTGKTEFCKCVAASLSCDLFAIGEADEYGDEPTRQDRLASLKLANRLTALRPNTLLLFDEMEDLQVVAGNDQSRGSKVYFNRLLEQNAAPVFWTTNATEDIDLAFLRRMTFVFEMRPMPRAARSRIWRHKSARHGIDLPAVEIDGLVRRHRTSPAMISHVTHAVALAGGGGADVDFAMRARFGDSYQAAHADGAERFDADLINADLDIEQLTRQLAEQTIEGRDSISLCLHGPSGTGKSAYARRLAEAMDFDPLVKRGSDLLSKWVGGTERLLAAAFDEARADRCFLIFDEVDSLLWNRSGAQHSWEASAVNELLQQMEGHSLPFACTTNFLSLVDRAALRRFTFKIGFDYLTPVLAQKAYQHFFERPAPAAVMRMQHLTPADFAVTARKARILGSATDDAALLHLLAQEVAAKELPARQIGFCR